MQAQMTPYSGTMITTELIQKYLDENKQLILAILDNQNLGKLHECAAYQSKLQQNLMYLAAIADAQPQPQIPAVQAAPMQVIPNPMLQTTQGYGTVMDQQQQQSYSQMAAIQAHQRLQQQQRMAAAAAAGIHQLQSPPHPDIDLGNNTGFPDYTPNGGEARVGPSAGADHSASKPSGADGPSAGDESGSTFLKASEEE